MFTKHVLRFDPNSRFLLVAPHPDDEALGCGVTLQRAVRDGAAIKVIYATDGDDNSWPQRVIERKWRLDANDRKRWGALRRNEALSALQVLGVNASETCFLGLPDQGLTALLARDLRSVIERLAAIIREWAPTHLLIPSVADTHPDHNALAVIMHLVLEEFFSQDRQIAVWSYAIHGQNPAFFEQALQDQPSEPETAVKIRAIRCHETQLKLSRRRFLAYATRPERFVGLSSREGTFCRGSIQSVSRTTTALRLNLQFPVKVFEYRAPRLLLFGYDRAARLQCIALQLPGRSSQVEMHDVANGRLVGLAEYRRHGFSDELTIPADMFLRTGALFTKIERGSFGFFDEAGWLEIPPVRTEEATSAPECVRHAAPPVAATLYASGGDERALVFSRYRWVALFAVVLIWLATVLATNIKRPWTNALDFNGAVWSQSAHNILRAGLAQTSGASSGFYFGPLPIPASGLYLHHPPLLHLAITVLFALLGEHEWVARLVPIVCSLTSAILIWLVVRSCANGRAATLSAAVFACLPMELRYGQMVNFEPCVLMLMLGTLWSLRCSNVSGKTPWRYAALGLVFVGLWVDWAMYLFVAALCFCRLGHSREDKRFVRTLLLMALSSIALYLIRIQLLRPDAWQNLSHTLIVRLGAGGHDRFTESQWIKRIFDSLGAHFLPMGWILAAIGSVTTFHASRRDRDLLWLFRTCLCIFLMDALFVGAFQNDSYIHHYISFYFVAPVAILAGIALDRLITLLQFRCNLPRIVLVGEVLVCLLLVSMGERGVLQTRALQQQVRILDSITPEPQNLIPELGDAIRKDFPPGTCVLCNFLPDYSPLLAYYAQRDILNNLSEYRFWQQYLTDPVKPIGGVIWIASNASRDLVAKLPPGNKQFLKVGNLSFCLWKRTQQPPELTSANTLH